MLAPMERASAEALEALACAALAGDREAFVRLSLELRPLVEASARRAARTDFQDEAQELFARLLERLEGHDFRGLRAFSGWKERHPEKDFLDWTRIVVANLSRDRARERLGRRRDDGELPSAKRLLNELAALEPLEALAYRPPVTTTQTAREILQFAGEHLPPLQGRVLAAWVEGASFEELRAETGLDSEAQAVKLVRAALATLRRRFARE